MSDRPITQGDPATTGRRRFLGQLGAGTAVATAAWVTPSIVGVHAAAAATPPASPFLATFGQAFTPGNDDEVTVTLATSPEAGDLVVAIFATNQDTTAIGGSPGFAFTEDAQNSRSGPGLSFLETVESWVFSRVAGAGEPTSYTFTRTAGGVNKRGFRVVLLVIRDTSGFATVPSSSTPGSNAQGFPTVTTSTAPNLVVHAGVGGSWNNILDWTSQPAGALVTDYPAGGGADDRRPMVVTEWDQPLAGTTAATSANLNGTRPYSVTWTMAFAPL